MKLSQVMKWSGVCLAIVMMVWASTLPLMSRMVVTNGLVKNSPGTAEINSPLSAQIHHQHVHNGDPVKAGDLLFELDDTVLAEQLFLAEQELLQAQSQLWHVESLIHGNALPWPSSLHEASAAEKQRMQQRLAIEMKSINEKETQLQAEIGLQSRSTVGIEQRMQSLEQAHLLLMAQHEQQNQLFQQGFLSTHGWIKSKELIVRSEAEKLETVAQLQESKDRTEVLKQEKAAWRSNLQSSWHQHLAELKFEIKSSSASIHQLSHQISQTQIRTSTNGIVQDIERGTPGTWVNATELMARIVPVNTQIWVDASLPEKDRAHVRQGMNTRIKLQAYDFTEFGALTGTVEWIAPDIRVQNKSDPPHYALRVRFNTPYPIAIEPTAGMQAQVDIEVGQRSVALWLLAPLMKLWQESLHEP